MPPFLMFKEVVFPMKPTLVPLARAEGTEESGGFGAMYFL
jgi:hypothetical protein